jgi:hypothetical protein
MSATRYQIIHYRYESRSGSSELVTAEELTRLARVHPGMLDRMIEWGLVVPAESQPVMLFLETAVPRIWKIMRLRRDLGINWAGIGVVLDLLDQIEELEREIDRLRRQL